MDSTRTCSMADTQPTGVCVLMASDVDALAAATEAFLSEYDGTSHLNTTTFKNIAAAARRARAALTKRLAVMGQQTERLVSGQACVVRLQDAGPRDLYA